MEASQAAERRIREHSKQLEATKARLEKLEEAVKLKRAIEKTQRSTARASSRSTLCKSRAQRRTAPGKPLPKKDGALGRAVHCVRLDFVFAKGGVWELMRYHERVVAKYGVCLVYSYVITLLGFVWGGPRPGAETGAGAGT